MSKITIKKVGKHRFEIKIKDFSAEDMNECFAQSIAMAAFQTYPDDPQFLIEFHTVLINKTQHYFNKFKHTKTGLDKKKDKKPLSEQLKTAKERDN